jgi:hypothetical protein
MLEFMYINHECLFLLLASGYATPFVLTKELHFISNLYQSFFTSGLHFQTTSNAYRHEWLVVYKFPL